jgi:hypothetical protein
MSWHGELLVALRSGPSLSEWLKLKEEPLAPRPAIWSATNGNSSCFPFSRISH